MAAESRSLDAIRAVPRTVARLAKSPHAGSRFAVLDGYRAVAALMVVTYHVAGTEFLAFGTTLSARLLNGLGNLGVTIFFLLSGFLLFRPFLNAHLRNEPAPPVLRYLRHRLLRIFPAYWLALTGLFILLPKSRLIAPTTSMSFPDYLSLYTLTMNFRPGFGFRGLAVAWTLHLEVAFYLALPIIAWAIRHGLSRRATTQHGRLYANLAGLGILFAIGIASHVVVAKTFSRPLDTQYHWLTNYLDWFALGMLLSAAVVWQDCGNTLPRIVTAAARSTSACWAVAAGLYVAYAYAIQPGPTTAVETLGQELARYGLSGLISVVILLPVTIGRNQRDPLWRAFTTGPVLFLGTISYGIYLWHTVFRAYLSGSTPPGGHFWSLFGRVLALTLVTATASWFLLEKPLMSFKDHRLLGGHHKSLDASPAVDAASSSTAATEPHTSTAPHPAEAADGIAARPADELT